MKFLKILALLFLSTAIPTMNLNAAFKAILRQMTQQKRGGYVFAQVFRILDDDTYITDQWIFKSNIEADLQAPLPTINDIRALEIPVVVNLEATDLDARKFTSILAITRPVNRSFVIKSTLWKKTTQIDNLIPIDLLIRTGWNQKHLSQITKLILIGPWATDTTLSVFLTQCNNLKMIALIDTEINQNGLRSLVGFKQLEKLYLPLDKFTDRFIELLKQTQQGLKIENIHEKRCKSIL